MERRSVLLLALRRLRAPLLLLVAVYAVGMIGLVLIPGPTVAGVTWHMGFFDAFYFMSYTASTIGFGEIPQAFSRPQRLWVSAIIYLSVIGWTYALSALLGLLQDPAFRHNVTATRFARRVRALREPFYLVCGFGETGYMLGRAFDHFGLRFVAVDIDGERVQSIDLLDLASDVPALAADARLPGALVAAGLTRPQCRGVLAITSDDDANLAVAIAVRLLNPRIPVLCRALSRETVANMTSFGTDHVINPFRTFATTLAEAIESPGIHALVTWLTGLPGTTQKAAGAPPRGRWIVCGHGRFGREMIDALGGADIDLVVVDPQPRQPARGRLVTGRGTEAPTLLEAGVVGAAGIVAGTDDDITNLSIAMTARELAPELYVITRQNLQANRALFTAFGPDMNMVASETVAHQCFAILHTPLLGPLLAEIRGRGDAWAGAVLTGLGERLGPAVPQLWRVRVDTGEAAAVHRALVQDGHQLPLDTLLRDPDRREERLAAVALYRVRAGEGTAVPAEDSLVETGDEYLFAGRAAAEHAQRSLLGNHNVLDYVLSGRDVPDGWVWKRLAGRGR